MSYFVRPMRLEDITQVARVEREVFATGWVVTPFRRELRKKSAAYFVACEATDPYRAEEEARLLVAPPPYTRSTRPVFRRFVSGLRGMVSEAAPVPGFMQRVVGYVGIWFMAGDGHITAIGVKEGFRRRGIGELLLLASIEASLPQECRVMTLEVRASNTGAQTLYEKYGFNRQGVRHGYYIDNREDAVIMTTGLITTPAYQERLEQLRAEHAGKWGESVRHLGGP